MWSLFVLLAVSGLDAVHSHSDLQGLSCFNNYIRNVSCEWLGSTVDPDQNCLITGAMKIGTRRKRRLATQTCKLEHHENFPPGCSFAFETEFNPFKLLNISLECDGVQVAALINYTVRHHVKMHPPDAPEVNVAVNGTLISWSESIPRPENIQFVDFNVQIRPQAEPWEKAYSLLTAECWIREASERFAGLHQVRVRVRPGDIQISHWSNWSPTVSWVGPISKDGTLDLMWIWGLTPLLAVVLAVILVLVGVRIRVRSRKLPKKQIPNPSKYFHVLHSVHGSNLKNWLNPLPASQSFYMTKQCEHISPIQLCENKAFDAAPPTLPLTGSTSALLHCKACSLTGSDTSRPLDNDCSSSSSSFYSNMGYFLTSSSGISARSDPNPAYFTYQTNSNSWQDDHNSLHLLCGPSVTGGHYESLKREPQSPDSGFCGDKVAEEEKNERVDVNDWKSLDLPHQHCPLDPTLPPPPPPFPDVLPLAEEPLDCPSAATPAADVAGGSYAAWPSAGSVARPSSVSVEANLSKTGYLTVKELQMTFRNKSI